MRQLAKMCLEPGVMANMVGVGRTGYDVLPSFAFRLEAIASRSN